jgi:hypothetical protein
MSAGAGFSTAEARCGDLRPEPTELESEGDGFWLEGSGMVITSFVTVGMGVFAC